MKKQVVKKQKDFDRIFQKGKRFFSKTLTLVCLPSNSLAFGISVGKKHGGAVQRNRIKRLIREAVRKTKTEWKNSWQVVLLPKISESYSFFDFENDLKWLIQKNGL